ncbi:uncharacterized protein At5g08430 isoform X2 [Arabidopsis lyrata subsp. lyrata]|uniref:uncharacterized protein At5g08430 isoform X2 n=1 Tax=Arabidopsis lyrata subsp. lyrata TaxID=81972 RepID=UPI000A29CDF4|nr:uncharacterized protein At5g08430 isoform X2 [Arabidopsis lyrata subsp. lyrata]|eukprot:XP_020869738.1 uncharacterized protein At5g08430 isoform X2 [Arabidopsis lyrata subsp. lyrata]
MNNVVEIVEEEEEDEKECEDWCFICKDGGNLILCDFKDCPKVYHESCVEKGSTASKNGDSYICMWHSCYLCKKTPKLCCLCCSHAVCEGCVTHAEFTQLKENKGLCNQCQEYVFALEEIQEYDAAGDKLDLTDRNTFECLFLEYWEIVKKQEDLTFGEVRNVCASKPRKKGVKSKYKDDPKFSLGDVHTSKSRKKGVKLKIKDDPKFSLSDHGVEDAVDYKTVGKKKRMEFIRWGSKPLIDFLTSIGEDTRDAMSQHSVESVIRRYIREKNLLDREKKKKVHCDEKLYSIFRKKSVNQKRIYTLLNTHLKENLDQVEYFTPLEPGFSQKKEKRFSEKNDEVLMPCKKQKTESSDEEICEKEVQPEMQATGFATINADNIKLVYLRKSLVVELLKQNERFVDKVVGSFVKVKNNPRDLMAYQILQVTGIKTADDQSEGVLLHVAGMASGISISKLDDSDISEEEIKDLKQKVMNGLLRQPTVVEMEQKAKALHVDITKHWIARQLIILQKRINRANEKGWRRELEEYLEQRELLEKTSEQERLLKETPRIIEDSIEIKQEPSVSGLSHEAVIEID